MYKNIADTFISLFKSRTVALSTARDADPRTFVENYFYPLVGIYAVALFVGQLIHIGSFDVAELLRHTLARLSALLMSYYLISLALRALYEKYSEKVMPLPQIQIYVACLLSVDIVTGVFLEFSFPEFMAAVMLYNIALIWEGSKSFLQLEEEKRLSNTLITIAVFFGIKMLVSFFFNKLLL